MPQIELLKEHSTEQGKKKEQKLNIGNINWGAKVAMIYKKIRSNSIMYNQFRNLKVFFFFYLKSTSGVKESIKIYTKSHQWDLQNNLWE